MFEEWAMEGLMITEEGEGVEILSRRTGEEEGQTSGEHRGDELYFQLRCVFDACDTRGTGVISLRELANISRSLVGDSGQLDQVLDILDGQGGGLDDELDLEQFYNKFITFMPAVNEDNRDRVVNKVKNFRDQGVFNENLRRSFDRANIKSAVSSPKKLQRSTNSQARLSGGIPLVNTSSEEEDDLEDSFDRKIAASLDAARPLVVEQKFLVRGVATRNTFRKTSSSSQLAGSGSYSPISTSTRKFSSTSPVSGAKMSPILAPSDSVCSMSSSSSSNSFETPGTRSGQGSPARNHSDMRLAIKELEVKVDELQGTAVDRQINAEYESSSSGVGNLNVELEEEISSSVQLARRYGEERLTAERQRHMEQVEALERERDLERRNFHLRLEQMRLEQDKMRRELKKLKEKLQYSNSENEHCEKPMPVMDETQRTDSPALAREMELLLSLNQLTSKVEEQDSQLAECKEDNIVLRSQIKSLREVVEATRGKGRKFRGIFGGRASPSLTEGDLWEDPADTRMRLRGLQKELGEQREVNKKLNAYVGEMLINIMVKNPQMLEKK